MTSYLLWNDIEYFAKYTLRYGEIFKMTVKLVWND